MKAAYKHFLAYLLGPMRHLDFCKPKRTEQKNNFDKEDRRSSGKTSINLSTAPPTAENLLRDKLHSMNESTDQDTHTYTSLKVTCSQCSQRCNI